MAMMVERNLIQNRSAATAGKLYPSIPHSCTSSVAIHECNTTTPETQYSQSIYKHEINNVNKLLNLNSTASPSSDIVFYNDPKSTPLSGKPGKSATQEKRGYKPISLVKNRLNRKQKSNNSPNSSVSSSGTPPLGKKPRRGGEGGSRWTKEEDEQLRVAVAIVEPKDSYGWKKIAVEFMMDRRSEFQCEHRWEKVLKEGLVKGPWTREEDQSLINAIVRDGIARWSLVAKHIPGRIDKQCRERWYNHVDPTLKKSNWIPVEDDILIEAQELWENSNSWRKIAKLLPGRSENAVKNRWNSAARRDGHGFGSKRKTSYLADIDKEFQGGNFEWESLPEAPLIRQARAAASRIIAEEEGRIAPEDIDLDIVRLSEEALHLLRENRRVSWEKETKFTVAEKEMKRQPEYVSEGPKIIRPSTAACSEKRDVANTLQKSEHEDSSSHNASTAAAVSEASIVTSPIKQHENVPPIDFCCTDLITPKSSRSGDCQPIRKEWPILQPLQPIILVETSNEMSRPEQKLQLSSVLFENRAGKRLASHHECGKGTQLCSEVVLSDEAEMVRKRKKPPKTRKESARTMTNGLHRKKREWELFANPSITERESELLHRAYLAGSATASELDTSDAQEQDSPFDLTSVIGKMKEISAKAVLSNRKYMQKRLENIQPFVKGEESSDTAEYSTLAPTPQANAATISDSNHDPLLSTFDVEQVSHDSIALLSPTPCKQLEWTDEQIDMLLSTNL